MISKVLEINQCNKNLFLEALYKPKFWEIISPVKKIEAQFTAPNVLYTKINDDINLPGANLVIAPIEMEGELVLVDKGEDKEHGRLIEFNVRNNKDIKELDGNMRIKELTPIKSKVGIYIHNFALSSNFLKLFGTAAEFILQTKISSMCRNLEKFCKNNDLKNLS